MAKYDGPIVITGMGAVGPFGLGVEAFWSALKQGERRGETLEQGEPGDQPVWGLKVGEWQPADTPWQARPPISASRDARSC